MMDADSRQAMLRLITWPFDDGLMSEDDEDTVEFYMDDMAYPVEDFKPFRNKDEILCESLTDEDIVTIQKLSKDPLIAERIIASIAPSIYGNDFIKQALALSLFGGVSKYLGENHRIRGDINVFIMGDSGTATSQFLEYAEMIAPRSVFTTCKHAHARLWHSIR